MTHRPSQAEYRSALSDQCEEYIKTIPVPRGQAIRMRRHQQSAMRKFSDELEKGEEEFAIVHPCGTGKTVLEAGMIKASQEVKRRLYPSERTAPKDLVLIVERSIMTDICEQIERVIGRNVGMWGDGKKKLEPNVIVSTIQVLQHHENDMEKFLDPRNVSLVISDEADKFLTERRLAILQRFNRAIHVGLTATPNWSDGRSIESKWREPIDKLSLKQGIERGINAPPMFYMYKADVDGDAIPVSGGDYEKTPLEKALKSVQIETAISRIYQKLRRVERKNFPTLVYVPSLYLLKEVTQRLQRDLGHTDLVISAWDGDTPSARIEEEKHAFKSGEIDILVLCEMGGRSLDLPRARFLIDASPTLSLNKLEQRHGRVLRSINHESPEAQTGFQKDFSLVVQILPRSNKFRPVTIRDVLKLDPNDYEPGEILIRPKGDGGGDGNGGWTEEVARIAEAFKSGRLTSSVRLMEKSDFRDILRRDDLPKLDRDGLGCFNE